jgi:hypothetical protein
MFGTLASIAGPAGLMETIEQDDSVFMELDRSPVSFDLAVFGSPSAHLSSLSRTLDAHLQSVAVSTLNPGKRKNRKITPWCPEPAPGSISLLRIVGREPAGL